MLAPQVHIKRLSKETRDDFYRVHRSGEYTDFCLCGYWWVPTSEGWDDRTEKEAVAQREDLFTRNISDGYLLYNNDVAIGWCQVYKRDDLPNLVRTFEFSPDADAWFIGCFMLVPDARGKGLAHQFLNLILKDLEKRGVSKVQAYPKIKNGLSANEVWTGPVHLYQKAGFQPVEEHAGRAIWQIDLTAGTHDT